MLIVLLLDVQVFALILYHSRHLGRGKADPEIVQSIKTQRSAKAPAFAKMQKQGFCTPDPFNLVSNKEGHKPAVQESN
jgi:hypothetical protein